MSYRRLFDWSSVWQVFVKYSASLAFDDLTRPYSTCSSRWMHHTLAHTSAWLCVVFSWRRQFWWQWRNINSCFGLAMYAFTLSNDGAYFAAAGREKWWNFGFLPITYFRRHFKKIGKHIFSWDKGASCEKVWRMSVDGRKRKWCDENKQTFIKYYRLMFWLEWRL